MKNFRDLHVWQKAHQLTLLLYNTTGTFPQDEKYGLVSQIKRAAASIYEELATEVIEVKRMLAVFIKKLRVD
jgi:hypothetical protein